MKRKKIDIFFILFDIGFTIENSSVFQSQVVSQMLYLKSIGYNVAILTLSENKLKLDMKIGGKLKSNGIKLFLIKKSFFIIDLIRIIFYSNILLFKYKIEKYYCRSFWGAIISNLTFPFKSNKLIYDVRADNLDEYNYIGMKNWKKKIYLFLEKWGIRNSSKVLAVSKFLSEKVKERFGVNRVYTIPCCLNPIEFKVSNKDILNLKNKLNYKKTDIIFVYSGGLSNYQQIPLMLDIWKDFIDYNFIKFLLLTNNDPRQNPTTVKSLNIFGDRLINLSLNKDEVPLYLNCADIGFMLRERRNLNRASSPIKFPEYLACGLKVVSSPEVGDISDCIIKYNCGIIIDDNSLKKGINNLKNLVFEIKENNNKKYSNNLPLNNYLWGKYKDTYKEIYN